MKATEIRKGNIVRYNNDPHRVLAMQHITPGNWRGMVQTKLRNVRTGASVEVRFRSEDEVDKMMVDTRQMQYLYHDQHGYHFMDAETYEQVALNEDSLGDAMSYVVPETTVSMEWIEGSRSASSSPPRWTSRSSRRRRGSRAPPPRAAKAATLETGLVVQVPPFIEEGESVRVSTIDGSYLERAK